MFDWGDYRGYEPPVYGPPEIWTKVEARESFADAMARKGERTHMLAALTRQNGLELGTDRDSVNAFGQWFLDNSQPDPELADRLLSRWYSVVFDSGLFVGDLIIAQNPVLSWKLQGGRKAHVAYQKPVIAGYPDDRLYSVDPDGYMEGCAYRAIAGEATNETPLWDYTKIAAGFREFRTGAV